MNRQEVDLLFSFVRSLRAQGTSFVYISHHLEEIFEICDRVTVMRDGRVIETLQVEGLTIDRLINSMVGESVSEYWRESTIEPEEVFCANNLSRRGAYENVTLSLRKGEVVGLCGLGGSGVGELARALFGMERRGVGEVLVNGKPLTATTPKAAFTQGIAYLPDDRQRFGIVALRPVRENITYSVLDQLANALGIVPRTQERATTSGYIDQLGIVTPSQDQFAGLLSGGNQQKVVFAKLAATKPAVLILHEPTQGVDVRAKVDIFDIISELSAKGVAILIISSEVRELSGLCDRILVMYEGRITREFDRQQGELSPQDILLAIEGGERAATIH